MPAADISGMLLSPEEPRVSDLSREVLTGIFGDNWWNLTESLPQSLPGQGIFELLMTLNAIAAVVIAWLMILTLLMSSAGAAQEGRAFGGKYFNPWVPLRFAFAIAAVTPVHHGLCAMQIMLLSCVSVSINMANYMHEVALDWLQQNGSLAAVATSSRGYSTLGGALDVGEAMTGAGKMSGRTLAVQILQTEAFLTYLHTQLGCEVAESGFAEHLEAKNESDSVTLLFVPSGEVQCERGLLRKSPEAFGGFRVVKAGEDDVVSSVAMEKRIALLKELVAGVEASRAHEHFAVMGYRSGESATVMHDRAVVQAEGARYAARLSALGREESRSEELQQKLDLFIENSRSLGWFGLGSHYWSLLTLEQELSSYDNLSVEWIEPRFRSFADVLPASFATSFWPRINEASYLGDVPSSSLGEKLLDYMSPFTSLTKRFAYALEASPDALLAMVGLARWCSGTCTAVLVAFEGAKLAALSGSKILTKNAAMRIADFFTGAGEAGDSVVTTLLRDLSFFLSLILLPLWVFSTFVAYLVPAIPFLIWVAAIAGWVVLTLEAVIAAPIWLIGHAMPEGEGFAGIHGRSGYILILSVLLRPCLLVLSMLTCFLVMRATGSIIGSLCAPFIDSQASLSAVSLGIVGCIFMFIIIAGAVTLLTWKLFALVTQMPDRIIRWLGQQIAHLGSESAEALGMKTFHGAERNARTLAHAGYAVMQRGMPGKGRGVSSGESGYLRMEERK